MPKKPQPQPAQFWIEKLGDNERKVFEHHVYFQIENAKTIYEFLWRSFRPRTKESEPKVKELVDTYFPKG